MLFHRDGLLQRRDAARAFTRAELLAEGWTGRSLAAAVRDGRLLRPRENVYLPADADRDLVDACRIGGALTCVSELARRGVFVLDASRLHVALHRNSSRLRVVARPTRLHWMRRGDTDPQRTRVQLIQALAEAIRCQEPRAAIASLDSAWNQGLITEEDIAEVFQRLPRRYRVLRRLLDRRAESGPESLMRLILRRLGCRIESQVWIDGVGRVDFVVDGWLIVECDSEAHHGGWAAQRRDRRRDQAAAASGWVTYRPVAEDIMWHQEVVLAAVRGLRQGRALRRAHG